MGNIENIVVGTCSICGGPVSIPRAFYSVNRPVPTCESCGATRKGGYGPVMPMEPRDQSPRQPLRTLERRIGELLTR